MKKCDVCGGSGILPDDRSQRRGLRSFRQIMESMKPCQECDRGAFWRDVRTVVLKIQKARYGA